MRTDGGETASTVAVGHYCEGAGHATRMLAVAERLADAGCEFEIAGGGPGERFVEANGYEEHPLPTVDFIGGYQGDGGGVVLEGVPNLLARVRAYVRWLRDLEPDVFLTDDITGCFAASLARQPYVYVSHDPTAFYETVPERASAWIRNRVPGITAEAFLFPKVWEGPPDIEAAVPVGPIAPAAPDDDALPEVDVLVVPSAFSVDESELADELAKLGRAATLVGGEDWELQPSLQPYVRAADLVVCSGYSTVMESAVAGTPCVVLPETSEQRGVAAALSRTPGFGVAQSIDDVLGHLGTLERPEARENGAATIADVVLDSLGERPADRAEPSH